MKELQSYNFSETINTTNKKDNINKRSVENYTSDNLKVFKFPTDMAEKMDKIHQNIFIKFKRKTSSFRWRI